MQYTLVKNGVRVNTRSRMNRIYFKSSIIVKHTFNLSHHIWQKVHIKNTFNLILTKITLEYLAKSFLFEALTFWTPMSASGAHMNDTSHEQNINAAFAHDAEFTYEYISFGNVVANVSGIEACLLKKGNGLSSSWRTQKRRNWVAMTSTNRRSWMKQERRELHPLNRTNTGSKFLQYAFMTNKCVHYF